MGSFVAKISTVIFLNCITFKTWSYIINNASKSYGFDFLNRCHQITVCQYWQFYQNHLHNV